MNRGGRGRGSGGRGRRPSTDKPTRGKGSKGSSSKSNSQGQGANSQSPGGTTDLNPVLQPVYPAIGKFRAMYEDLNALGPNLITLTQYFKSNYSIPIRKGKMQSPFHVDRYSDRYNEPMTIDPHLQHTPHDKRLPPELLTKGISRNSGAEFEAAMARKRKCMEYNLQRKMQELAQKADAEQEEDDDDYVIEEVDLVSSSEDDEGEIKPVKIKKVEKATKDEDKPPEDEEEEPDEMEEELDAGTDYMANYFDNGEDYLDEEDDNLDDNAVY